MPVFGPRPESSLLSHFLEILLLYLCETLVLRPEHFLVGI
jgi:hypothetical protein